MDDQRTDALTATYADFTGHPVNFAALVREKKRAIVESTFSADLERLARRRSRSRARAGKPAT
jgi:maltooligosyltrehalose synthase